MGSFLPQKVVLWDVWNCPAIGNVNMELSPGSSVGVAICTDTEFRKDKEACRCHFFDAIFQDVTGCADG
jgi:hypothetical protein